MFRHMFQIGCAAILVSLAAVAADDPQVKREPKPAERKTATIVNLREGEPKALRTKEGLRFISIAGHNPKVLEINAIKPDVISLTGLSIGHTSVVLTDEKGQKEELIILVGDKPEPNEKK